jgi:hypothetical protein
MVLAYFDFVKAEISNWAQFKKKGVAPEVFSKAKNEVFEDSSVSQTIVLLYPNTLKYLIPKFF